MDLGWFVLVFFLPEPLGLEHGHIPVTFQLLASTVMIMIRNHSQNKHAYGGRRSANSGTKQDVCLALLGP